MSTLRIFTVLVVGTVAWLIVVHLWSTYECVENISEIVIEPGTYYKAPVVPPLANCLPPKWRVATVLDPRAGAYLLVIFSITAWVLSAFPAIA